MLDISDKIRINEKIKGNEFRIISETGEQLGIMDADKALAIAMDRGYDLVEISPNGKPPVCKFMNYGKYKYEQTRKIKEQKKNQKQIILKEVKITARIDVHDLDTKINQIEKFLSKENKVKVTLVLFGRERTNPNIGNDLLDDIATKFQEKTDIEKNYNDNKQRFIILTPKNNQ